MARSWSGRNVLILNWRDLDHPQAGGAEVFAERVAGEFARAGANVTLLSARTPGLPAETRRNGFRVRRMGGVLTVYPAVLTWLFAHRRNIDGVIDCQNGIPFFSPLVVRRRTPVVQVVHHVHQRQFGLFFGPRAAFVARQLEGRGTRLIYRRRSAVAVSPSTREELRSVLRLMGPRFLVPNGLDPIEPQPAVPRSPTATLVYVGRLVRHKRLELLLETLPELCGRVPGLTLHVIGDGPDAQRLRAIGAGLVLPKEALVWHGRVPDRTRDALLRAAWLFVNPTHGEGWGLGVLEAASHGGAGTRFPGAGAAGCHSARADRMART